jgi:hypothetical protein
MGGRSGSLRLLAGSALVALLTTALVRGPASGAGDAATPADSDGRALIQLSPLPSIQLPPPSVAIPPLPSIGLESAIPSVSLPLPSASLPLPSVSLPFGVPLLLVVGAVLAQLAGGAAVLGVARRMLSRFPGPTPRWTRGASDASQGR